VKAIIQKDGKITYKIIGEIEYEVKLWILTKTKDRFQVIAENKAYNVILAAVTYLKAQVGDTVSIRVPKWKEATYGALEAVIPKKD
jgi:protein involved in polysaccharide export with SLBB domain